MQVVIVPKTYAQAGITDPRKDFDCAEVYVPFSWYEPMVGESWLC